MNDILLKNIEMPTSCNECRFHSMQNVMHKARVIHLCYAQEIGQSCYVDEVPTRLHDGCPLVALPSHGRLISDTDVKDLLHSGLSLDTDSDIDHVCGLIDGLPTILEATE